MQGGRIDYTIYRTKDKRRCKMLISTPYFFILKFKTQMELHLNKYAEFN